MNDYYIEATVRARKQRDCCECGKPIRPGAMYRRCNGCTDGRPWCISLCAKCARVADAYVAVLRKSDHRTSDEDDWPIGEMLAWLREDCRDDEPFLSRFRARWFFPGERFKTWQAARDRLDETRTDRVKLARAGVMLRRERE